MQIRLLRFLMLVVITLVMTNDVWGLGYKFYLDADGQATRKNDLRQKPEFEKSGFITGICDGKSVSGAKTYCVKLFSDSQVHDMKQAIQIAKDYAYKNNKDEITCYEQYYGCEIIGCDDHIYCSTVPGKNTYYEFVFDDIKDKTDSDYKKGIADAYCKMFFGEKSTLESKEERDYSSSLNAGKMSTVSTKDKIVCYPPDSFKTADIYDTCDALGKTLEASFGYYTNPSSYSCEMNFRTTQCSSLVNNLPEIDNSFKTLQLNLDNSTVMWLAGYVKSHVNQQINEFRCDFAAHTCKTGDLKNPDDDVLTCYADDKRIDFRFDDLSETKSKWIKASEDAKECISEDGIFDGRHCQGINEEACNKLKNNKGIDIEWDDNIRACVLKSANTVANINRAGEIAATVGVGTGIVIATVATGGSAAMVILTVGGAVAATGSQTLVSVERNQVDKFISDLLACSGRDCVRENFVWFIDTGSTYINNLTNEQVDAIDKAVAKKLDNLDMNSDDDKALVDAFEKSTDKDLLERCKGSGVQSAKCAFDAASVILDFLPVTRAAVKATGAIPAFVAKFGSKLPNTAKVLMKLRITSKVGKGGLKVIDKLDTLNDINAAVQGAGMI